MADDLSSLSVDQLVALAQGGNPTPVASADLSSMQTADLVKLASSSQNQDYNPQKSIQNFGSGLVEGTTGLMGLLTDLNPFNTQAKAMLQMQRQAEGKQSSIFPASETITEAQKPYLAEQDPQYRYARTLGNFLAPVPIKGANTLRAGITNVFSGLGAQGAEDLTGDKKVAPILGAIGAGSVVSALTDVGSLIKRVLVGANPDEITGSAAKALLDQTGLKADDLAAANMGPQTPLSALETTAERTGNAGVAQIEKSLAATGENANIYANLDAQRNAVRNQTVDAATTVPQVNKEGLNAALIDAAETTQGKMQQNSSSFWQGVPEDEIIPIAQAQVAISSQLAKKKAGLNINPQVRELAEQMTEAKGGALSSGDLQLIRSDALSLMRDKTLTGFEKSLLKNIEANIDNSMAAGLSPKSYETWRAARQSTAAEKATYARGTAGGYLVGDQARVSNTLDKVFKGDAQSIDELRAAIGANPELMESVKRGIIDKIPRNVQGEITPAGMNKFLTSNESGLRNLLGEDHFNNFSLIARDLKSQANVQDLAFKASKGNSVTSQKNTVMGAIQEAATDSLIPGSGGPLGKVVEAFKRGAGIKDAKGVEDLLFKAALDPNFAEQLARTPTRVRILDMLESLQNAGNNLLTTGATVAAKELTREQDNRSPLAQQMSKVLENKTSQSLAAKVLGEQPMAKTPEFEQKAAEVADRLGVEPMDLLKVIGFETGGSFSATQKNKAGSGATGLIQFMPETAKELLKTDTKQEAIKQLENMTDVEQLDVVEKYLSRYKGKIKTLDDLYMAVLYPKAIDKDAEYALFKEGSIAYKQNKGLDLDKDGRVTKNEAASKVRNYQA